MNRRPNRIDPFLHPVPVLCLPKYAVIAFTDDYTAEDIAWFWSKRLAAKFIRMMNDGPPANRVRTHPRH